jgi:hypothetical protein
MDSNTKQIALMIGLACFAVGAIIGKLMTPDWNSSAQVRRYAIESMKNGVAKTSDRVQDRPSTVALACDTRKWTYNPNADSVIDGISLSGAHILRIKQHQYGDKVVAFSSALLTGQAGHAVLSVTSVKQVGQRAWEYSKPIQKNPKLLAGVIILPVLLGAGTTYNPSPDCDTKAWLDLRNDRTFWRQLFQATR